MNETLRYYLGFSMVNGIGPVRLDRLIAYCGTVADAWHASLSEMIEAGIERRWAEALVQTRRKVNLDRELERTDRLGIQLICREDPAFPISLLNMPAPPPLLYVSGQLLPGDSWGVAMVGTRSPTSYGREAARRLAGELAVADVTLVSGLAIGIDATVHTAAIEAGGRTVAVLPCGADLVYPERHHRLAAQIRETGALISEFPLGTRPLPQLFPVRNRLISGLARGVVVVEARLGSGALITVDYALEQGREVLAVPGPIYSPASVGPHKLLKQGASLATSAADILEALHLNNTLAIRAALDDLPEEPSERAILQLLSYEPCHIDEIGRTSGMPIEALSATLVVLELKGLARQAGPMEFVRS